MKRPAGPVSPVLSFCFLPRRHRDGTMKTEDYYLSTLSDDPQFFEETLNSLLAV